MACCKTSIRFSNSTGGSDPSSDVLPAPPGPTVARRRAIPGVDPLLPLMNGSLRVLKSKLSNAHEYAVSAELQCEGC
jgi:hypothetical protein